MRVGVQVLKPEYDPYPLRVDITKTVEWWDKQTHIPITIWEEIDNKILASRLWTTDNKMTITNRDGKIYLVSEVNNVK